VDFPMSRPLCFCATLALMMPSVANVVVLVLAAGQGKRFLASGGSCHKLDADVFGQSVLARTLAAVRSSGLRSHVVHAAPALRTMGDSIAQGVRDTAWAHGWLVLPADLPLIRPQTLRAVAAALQVHGAVRPQVMLNGAAVAGHPVGFARQARLDVLACAGQSGASSVFRHHVGKLMPSDDLGSVADVDTVVSLEKVRALWQRNTANQ
jgi:molybdenum cofactor cytidylyltransferase